MPAGGWRPSPRRARLRLGHRRQLVPAAQPLQLHSLDRIQLSVLLAAGHVDRAPGTPAQLSQEGKVGAAAPLLLGGGSGGGLLGIGAAALLRLH